jgi:hypothetical protein
VTGIDGGLGTTISVVVFGTTTTQLLLASAGGFLIGAAIGLFVGARIKSDQALVRTDQLLKVDVVPRMVIAWGLVALGIAGLVLRGWNVRIALVTLGFLIVALLCTFHRTMREGPDFERFRK